ncbi:MAG: Ig-like domain-containing protein [Acetivibrionales bacterium]
MEPTELTLTVGDTGQITATVEPDNATNKDVTWESSDDAVATVENGLVTAVGAGEATITVTTVDGEFKATTTVTVLTEGTVAMIGDTGYESIQDAIDDAVVGDNIIKVYSADHGTDSIEIIQREGVNITLEAVGEVELKNQIRISGAGRWNGEETLTIKGFTFDFTDATEAVDIISATKGVLDDTNNYAHNVSIENNVFKGNPSVDVVAIRTNGVFGLEIKSSQGIGLHSLGQIQAQSKYFRVIDTTVEGGESGINYYGPADVEITGLTVEGTGYGVRAGQSSGVVNETAKLTISDSNLTALYPVWLRGDAPRTVTITNSTLVHTEGGERIKNDAGVNVLEDPTVYNKGLETYYMTIQEAIDAAVVGENIIEVYPRDYGTDSIEIIQREGVNITLEAVGEVELKNQIKIDGQNRSSGEESLTIKGFTFDFTDANGAVDIISAVKGEIESTNNYAHNITIENNVFKGNPSVDVVAIRTNGVFGLEIKSSQGIGLHSLGQIQAQSKYFRVIDTTVEGGESGINYYGPADVEITGLTVEGTGYGVRAGQSSGVVNETAKLTISDSNLTALYPVWLRGDAPRTVTITNSTLVHTEGGERIKNDAGVNVLEDPTVYNKGLETYYMTIQEAIDAAVVGENIIEVYPRDYGTDSIEIIQREGVNITLEAVGEVELKNQIRISGAGRWNGEETLTIKGFTFDFTDATEAVDIISATKGVLDDTNNYAHNVSIENNVFKGNPSS